MENTLTPEQLAAQGFANPPVSPVVGDVPSVAGNWDGDDDSMLLPMLEQSRLPSSMVDPVEMVGPSALKKAISEDVVFGGAQAVEGIRTNWDWVQTPAQRARSLADSAFTTRMDALVKSAVAETVKAPVDPEKYAVELAERRSRRR